MKQLANTVLSICKTPSADVSSNTPLTVLVCVYDKHTLNHPLVMLQMEQGILSWFSDSRLKPASIFFLVGWKQKANYTITI